MSEIIATPAARQFRVRRRRFLVVAIAALVAVGAALGVSFTADTGTTDVTITPGTTGSLVYASGATLPTGFTFKKSGTGTAGAPAWSPVAGSAGSVTTPGDLAVIDARTASAGGASNLTVTVYVTNLAALQKDYSSFAWPVRIYSGTFTAAGPSTVWSSTYIANTDKSYLTNTGGYLTFTVPTAADATAGNVLGVTIGDVGSTSSGSFYTTSTTASGGSLSPQFFITAQPS
jgi:hypothetical protein